MSEDEETSSWCCISCCASCGIAAVDDVKLRECDGCDLVQYCSDESRELHRPEHEEDCKKRAAAIIRDELLFKQPESSHMGDCPICMLPLPIGIGESTMSGCCSTFICHGCVFANQKREAEMGLQNTCPFCREAAPATREEAGEQRMKRVDANDPNAIRKEGSEQNGKGDYSKAFEYWKRAAELGDAEAHLKLACTYHLGECVEKDFGKYIHHLEEAAIIRKPGVFLDATNTTLAIKKGQ